MIPRPFDESAYPLDLPPALCETIAACRYLATKQQAIRTMTIAQALGISRNASYKRLRRLRDLGILTSQLILQTDPTGSYFLKTSRQNGGVRFFSWLEFQMVPLADWGNGQDTINNQFDPRNGKD